MISIASFYYEADIPAVFGGGALLLILIYFFKNLHWGLALLSGCLSGGLIGFVVAQFGAGDMLDIVQIFFAILGAVAGGLLSFAASIAIGRRKDREKDL